MSSLAELVEGCTRTEIGFRVQESEEFIVEVWPMLFNFRVVVGRTPLWGTIVEHGYCYFGRGPGTLQRALQAARDWEDPLTSAPAGFDKQAF